MKLDLLSLCLQENRKIPDMNLAKLSWGNYSCIDRSTNLVYIKPSGVDLFKICEKDISVLDLSGNQISGLKCSIDSQIHLAIYKNMSHVNSVCHTHSTYATSFAQSGRSIEMYGTTHADTFAGPIRILHPKEQIYHLGKEHERALGEFIVENLTDQDSNAILIKHHGPFVWSSSFDAVSLAIALEEIAKMAFLTENLDRNVKMPKAISNFHWDRKHGKEKRYGQGRN